MKYIFNIHQCGRFRFSLELYLHMYTFVMNLAKRCRRYYNLARLYQFTKIRGFWRKIKFLDENLKNL